MKTVLVVLLLSCTVVAAQEQVPTHPTAGDPRAPGPLSPDLPPSGADRRPVTAPANSQMAPLEPTRVPEPALPWAGYQNGTFYLHDSHDWFVIYPKGRLQIDGFLFPNRGASPATGVTPNSTADARPKDTLFVRRARVELVGTLIGHFDFTIAAEYASTPQTGATGTVADAHVTVDYLSWLKLQVGQFDAPFTLENRTSDKYLDFMERSLAVRAFSVPYNKDQGGMLWGWLPKQLAYYSLGVFDGDGGSFKSQDSRPAIIGRGFIAPLAFMGPRYPWLQQLWVGGSLWWKNEVNAGGPVAPSITGAAQNDLVSMTTQGAQTFFSSSYADGTNAAGNAVRSHLAPWGRTLKWAIEANVPFWRRMGARFELVHDDIELARYDDSNPANAALARAAGIRGARLRGTAWYVELYGWLVGDSTFLETPGLEPMPRLKRGPVARPRWALMAALKYEHLGMTLAGVSSAGTGVSVDPTQGHYSVHTFEAGLNAWGTKHARISANYVVNYIDGTSAQVQSNYFYRRAEHEVLLRLAINP